MRIMFHIFQCVSEGSLLNIFEPWDGIGVPWGTLFCRHARMEGMSLQ